MVEQCPSGADPKACRRPSPPSIYFIDAGSMKVNRIFFLYQSSSLLETAAMEGYLKDFKEKFRDEFF